MFKIKDCLSYLKLYQPRIISNCKNNITIKKVSHISENVNLKSNTIYIGRFSEVEYRFHLMEGMTLFLLNDLNFQVSRIESANNCIVVFQPDINVEELYDKCKEYLAIQEEVMESSHRLMDIYLMEGSLQSILDTAADIIQNPLMVIDNGYRVLGYSNSDECGDSQWMDCIDNGYCSYEFISQFNQLSEIRSLQKEVVPFFAGCMMSPIRRGIAKIFVNKKLVGYLLSIESLNPFSEGVIQILEIVAKFVSKALAFSALESGHDIYHSPWDFLINAIEDRPGSKEVLGEYLKKLGFQKKSQYYLILISLEKYTMNDQQVSHLYDIFQPLFPLSLFCYYEYNVLILIDSRKESSAVAEKLMQKEDIMKKRNLKAALSDGFSNITKIERYYQQVKRTQILMNELIEKAVVCSYDEVRRYDMFLVNPDIEKWPLYIRSKERQLYEYDKKHGTEFFETLYSYIKNSRSLQAVSDELHIHKNTVTYRVGRIKELFNLNLNDAEVRVGIYLAYHTFQLMDKGLLYGKTDGGI